MKCPNCLIELKEHPQDRMECSECGFNLYKNKKIIESVYIWLSVDSVTGYEGMIGIPSHSGTMLAASSDLNFVLKLEPLVRRAARIVKMDIKLVEFKRGDIIKC
jgi:hypothetical protein